jgi:dihydropyrimidine dehydrogenase (NAD+) subunit PreA
MRDLTVEFAGIEIPNPVLVTSCSWTATLDGIIDVAEAGAGIISTKTISDRLLPDQKFQSLQRNGTLFVPSDQRIHLSDAVQIIAAAKKRTKARIVANIIARSNHLDEWVHIAAACQNAGADFIEVDLNGHTVAGDKIAGSPEGAKFQPPSIGQDPTYVLEVVRAVKQAMRVPVITKLTPATADLIAIMKAAMEAKTDAVSLLNAVGGIPGLDIRREGRPLYENIAVQGLSSVCGASIGPMATWHTAVLHKLFPKVPLASGGGVMSGEQGIERLLLGASLMGFCSAVYISGSRVLTDALTVLGNYMDEFGYSNIESFRGKAQQFFGPSDFWK